MQFAKTPDSIESRISHYLTRLASLQKLKGKNYSEVRDVFVILISDKTLYDDPEHLAHFRMTSEEGRKICPELNIIVLELQKLRNKAILKEDLKLAEKWGLFFSYAHDENKKNVLQQIIENEEGINMANQVLEGITQEDIDSGIEFLKWQREYKRAVIVEEGRKQGLAEGKIETARNMKAGGISAEQIQQFTGLAEDEY